MTAQHQPSHEARSLPQPQRLCATCDGTGECNNGNVSPAHADFWECPDCEGTGEAFRDPLVLLQARRRSWRTQRGAYLSARGAAMRPSRLPSDFYADPLFRQALAETKGAIEAAPTLDFFFRRIYGRAA